MNINQSLNNFYNNTKNIYMGIGLTLFLIIIFIILPYNVNKLYSILSKIIIIIILCFLFYKNNQETHKLFKKYNSSNKKDSSIQNSIYFSYTMSLTLFILIFYIFYIIFY